MIRRTTQYYNLSPEENIQKLNPNDWLILAAMLLHANATGEEWMRSNAFVKPKGDNGRPFCVIATTNVRKNLSNLRKQGFIQTEIRMEEDTRKRKVGFVSHRVKKKKSIYREIFILFNKIMVKNLLQEKLGPDTYSKILSMKYFVQLGDDIYKDKLKESIKYHQKQIKLLRFILRKKELLMMKKAQSTNEESALGRI